MELCMLQNESVSCSVSSDSFVTLQRLQSTRLLCLQNSSATNTGVGSHSLLHGIFPIQRLNPGLLHCRHFLYHLSHQGRPYVTIPVVKYFDHGPEAQLTFHTGFLSWPHLLDGTHEIDFPALTLVPVKNYSGSPLQLAALPQTALSHTPFNSAQALGTFLPWPSQWGALPLILPLSVSAGPEQLKEAGSFPCCLYQNLWSGKHLNSWSQALFPGAIFISCLAEGKAIFFYRRISGIKGRWGRILGAEESRILMFYESTCKSKEKKFGL